MFTYIFIIYIILLAFGAKSTWKFVANNVLAGSSGLLGPILLFILVFSIAGPIMGIVNLGKLAFIKLSKPKIDQNQ